MSSVAAIVRLGWAGVNGASLERKTERPASERAPLHACLYVDGLQQPTPAGVPATYREGRDRSGCGHVK